MDSGKISMYIKKMLALYVIRRKKFYDGKVEAGRSGRKAIVGSEGQTWERMQVGKKWIDLSYI